MNDVAVPKCKFQNLSTGSIDSYVREESDGSKLQLTIFLMETRKKAKIYHDLDIMLPVRMY